MLQHVQTIRSDERHSSGKSAANRLYTDWRGSVDQYCVHQVVPECRTFGPCESSAILPAE